MENIENPSATATDERTAAARIYVEWDHALANGDVDALLACYADDAILESPLVPHLLGKNEGICRGRAELRRLFEAVAERKPKLRRHYRPGYFTDGKTLMFEYPRDAPTGEQMDFVEVMHLRAGLIQYHKVYWGWRGAQVLGEDAYRS
ncbi:MAG TPA: nuclear transport factor 2 family protein [Polyangia bacterium]|nr:nuclear transport factor 2 family protein [Polyangia bacterium]